MKFKQLLPFLVLILLLGFVACDIVDEPVDPNRDVVSSGRKVLIEDFTGHQCGNCPRAHEAAASLKAVYGEDLVVVALHVGGFARLTPSQGYTTNYKTPFGDAMEAYYNADVVGLPVGLVNRRAVNGNVMRRHSSWGADVAAILSEAPVLGIKLKTSFAATNRVASISADLEYFQPGTADHQIVVVITEDSIFSKQADYTLQPDYVLNYCQKHVLRKSVTSGIWGEQIKPGTIFVGEKFTKNFDTGIDPAWDVSQCHVVVYVLDNASKEILQVEEAHF